MQSASDLASFTCPHYNDMQLIDRQMAKQMYIPRSYVKGATPENGYELPDPPYEFEFSDNPYSGDEEEGPYKVFVASSGAASARPMMVRRNNRGIWKAYEWSSLLVGIQEAETQEDDDL